MPESTISRQHSRAESIEFQESELHNPDSNEAAYLVPLRHEHSHMDTTGNNSSSIGSRSAKPESLRVQRGGDGAGERGHRANSPWLFDVIAVFVSGSACFSLIALLIIHDSRPITSWTFFLPLNAVVSILGAISRSSLAFAISDSIGQSKWNWFKIHSGPLATFNRFDEATRGPWGSMKLLWWSRFRYAKTESLMS
jgi:hypothetical protein